MTILEFTQNKGHYLISIKDEQLLYTNEELTPAFSKWLSDMVGVLFLFLLASPLLILAAILG